jgi:hypothetical protein
MFEWFLLLFAVVILFVAFLQNDLYLVYFERTKIGHL